MDSIYSWLCRVRPAFVGSFLKKVLRIRRRVVETSQGRFFVDPASEFGRALCSPRGYEPQLISSLQTLLKAGDTFVDVGANEGFYSILASRLVGASGIVICVEPQSRLQAILFRNIAENAAHNVHVFQRAIGDAVGIATLCITPDVNTGASGLFRMTRYKLPTESVPQTTLTNLLKLLNLPRIKLMKIDIEGFEYEAVLGSRELFEQGVIEHLALELHPHILKARGKREADILDFLTASGYVRNDACQSFILTHSRRGLSARPSGPFRCS
jgi:FkbM family methyltransferase